MAHGAVPKTATRKAAPAEDAESTTPPATHEDVDVEQQQQQQQPNNNQPSSEPRPQSVLSLHSCLSNTDVPADDSSRSDLASVSDLLSPLPDDLASLAGSGAAASLEPIDEDYISAEGGDDDAEEEEDDDNATTINGDTAADADAGDSEAEEQELQSKIADLRARKEDMLSLVRELQTMNDLSSGHRRLNGDEAAAASPPRSVPTQFERIVPIELVAAARSSHSKSTSASPGAAARRPLPVVSSPAPPPPALKPLTSGQPVQTLDQKLSEISALKQKLTRLQSMMNTVNSIEQQQDQPAAAPALVDDRSAAPAPATPTSTPADLEEQRLLQQVNSIQSMTADLRLQSATLAAERDRLRDIRNDLARHNELKDGVLQDLERHVASTGGQRAAKPPSGFSGRAAAQRRRYDEADADGDEEEDDDDDDVEEDRRTLTAGATRQQTFNDLGGGGDRVDAMHSKLGFKKSLSEEPWRRRPTDANMGALRRYALFADDGGPKCNAAFADRYGLGLADGGCGGDLTTQTTSADEASDVRSEGSKFGGGGHSFAMPPPMRSLLNASAGYAESEAPGLGASNCCAGLHHQQRPTASNASSATATAAAPQPPSGSFGDPVLLQQFIQAQQMLINSVSQCNQLLWDQQRDINTLNSAVIVLQERILNLTATTAAAQQRTDTVVSAPPPPVTPTAAVVGMRAESVPAAYQHAYRAQSEQLHPNSRSHPHQCCTPVLSSVPSSSATYPRHYASSTVLAYTPPQPQPTMLASGRPPLPQHHHHHHHQHHQHPQHQHQQAPPQTPPQPHYQPHSAPLTNHHHPSSHASQRGHSLAPSTQFPLPPPREFHHHHTTPARPHHHHHQHHHHSMGAAEAPIEQPPPPPPPMVMTHHIVHQQSQPHAVLNNHPNSPLFGNGGGGGVSPNAMQPQSQQMQLGPGSLGNPPMFVYHNNHHGASNANNLGGSNINSNHTIAANLNNMGGGAGGGVYGGVQQQQPITLNNQVPPGNRANNYWDNFRSYSRQNLLSTSTSCNKSNENVCSLQPPAASASPTPLLQPLTTLLSSASPATTPQQQQHPSQLVAAPHPPHLTQSAAALHDVGEAQHQQHEQHQQHHHHYQSQQQQQPPPHMSHNILPVMDNKYFMHYRNQIHHHQQQHQQQPQQQQHEQPSMFYYDDTNDEAELLRQPLRSHRSEFRRQPAATAGHHQPPADAGTSSGSYRDTIAMLINEHNKHSAAHHQTQQQQQMSQTSPYQQQPPPPSGAEYFGGAVGPVRCSSASVAGAPALPDYPMDLNLSSRRMPEKPSVKLFDFLYNDVYTAVAQLIAENAGRPEFLVTMFRELRQLSRNDPLRARLMQAFEQLEPLGLAAAVNDDGDDDNERDRDHRQQRAQTMQQPQRPAVHVQSTAAAVFDADTDRLIDDIADQVEQFLLDDMRPHAADNLVDDAALRERIATIVMRRVHAHQAPSSTSSSASAQPPLLHVSREQLLGRMPLLDRRRPVQFLGELQRYLQQLSQPAGGHRNCNVIDAQQQQHHQQNHRRKRRVPQKTAAAAAAASSPARIQPAEPNFGRLLDAPWQTESGRAAAAAPSASDADLAEADQRLMGVDVAAAAAAADSGEENADNAEDGAAGSSIGANDAAESPATADRLDNSNNDTESER